MTNEERFFQENHKLMDKVQLLNEVIDKQNGMLTMYESVIHSMNEKFDEMTCTIMHQDRMIRELEYERKYNRLGKL